MRKRRIAHDEREYEQMSDEIRFELEKLNKTMERIADMLEGKRVTP